MVIRNNKCNCSSMVFGISQAPSNCMFFLSFFFALTTWMPFSLLCFTQILCSICSLTCALRKTEVNYLSPLLYPHPAHMTVHQARNSGIHISPTILPSSASGHYRLQNLRFSRVQRPLGSSKSFSHPSWEASCNSPSRWISSPWLPSRSDRDPSPFQKCLSL